MLASGTNAWYHQNVRLTAFLFHLRFSDRTAAPYGAISLPLSVSAVGRAVSKFVKYGAGRGDIICDAALQPSPQISFACDRLGVLTSSRLYRLIRFVRAWAIVMPTRLNCRAPSGDLRRRHRAAISPRTPRYISFRAVTVLHCLRHFVS